MVFTYALSHSLLIVITQMHAMGYISSTKTTNQDVSWLDSWENNPFAQSLVTWRRLTQQLCRSLKGTPQPWSWSLSTKVWRFYQHTHTFMHILIIHKRKRKGRRWPILKPIVKTEDKTYIHNITSNYNENWVQEAKLTTTIQEKGISYSLSLSKAL